MATQPNALSEKVYFENIAATTAAFLLQGGLYGVTISATFGPGSVALQRLAQDATTYVTCLTAFTAAGYATVSLPPGTYRFLVTTTTAIYVDIASVAGPA